MIGIKHISSYLPEAVLGNEELERRFPFPAGFLERKVGILERRVAAADQSTSDLALEAGRLLLGRTGLDPRDIDLVIVCTQNPDYKLPHTAALVQNGLGIPTTAAAFDISLGCSGFVYCLGLIQGWMQVHDSKNTLLFTCDPYSKVMNPEDRSTVPIFSDAAAATWIGPDATNHFGKPVFGTDGARYQALIVRNSGTREEPKASPYLHMDGRVIYEYMMRTVPTVVRQCLEENGLSMEEIDYFILHQASAHLLNGLRSKIGIPEHKLIQNLARVGNTVSSTIPIVLEELMAREDLSGKTLLLCGFGVGLSWGATVLTFSETTR